MNDKAITPISDNSKEFGKEFTAFAESMPTVKPELQMQAFLAIKSGKYKLEPNDQVTTTDELDNTSYES